jgi:hypothetical protein
MPKHTESSVKSRMRGLRPFPKGVSGNPGGRKGSKRIAQEVASILKPSLERYGARELIERGRQIDAGMLLLMLKARYEMLLSDPETEPRSLVALGGQVLQWEGHIGPQRSIGTQNNIYLSPGSEQRYFAWKAQQDQMRAEKESLLLAAPLSTLGGGDICVSSDSSDPENLEN